MEISFFELPGSLKGDRLSHAGTAEPLRVAPPKAVAYLVELSNENEGGRFVIVQGDNESVRSKAVEREVLPKGWKEF